MSASGVELVTVRDMVRRDVSECLAIERDSFDWPWDEGDFFFWLGQRRVRGLVAQDYSGRVVGHLVYERSKHAVELATLAVCGRKRRCGVGSCLVLAVARRARTSGKDRVVCQVSEYNLDAQLFFRQLGFRADQVQRDFYGSGHAAYELSLTIEH